MRQWYSGFISMVTGCADQERYLEVAVALPLHQTYSYRLPASWGEVQRGQRLLVPFGRRKVTAFVLAIRNEPPPDVAPEKFKEPIDVLEDETFFDETMLRLLAWVARYYRHPLGEVMATAFPGDVTVATRKVYRLTELGAQVAKTEPEEAVRAALRAIAKARRGLTATALQKKMQGSLHVSIAALERRGLIEAEHVERGRRIPKEKVWRVDPRYVDASADTLSPKARRVLAYLLGHGEATVRELQSEYGSVASSLKVLASRGIVVPGQRERRIETTAQEPTLVGAVGAPLQLNIDQALAVERISQAISERVFSRFLLQGVTGSGKTEVYIRLAEHTLAIGRAVLVLVPEISLTPQLIARFANRLQATIAVLHSGMPPAARFDMFRRAARGESRVVIGARSAVFAPLRDVGLIIVDEEHEASYKQEEVPRYHARDTALYRGQLTSCPVVLGSATPSLESRYACDVGRYTRYFLPRRATVQHLPEVRVVDMKNTPAVDPQGSISAPLFEELQRTLSSGRQAILFLNRRGYAPFVICPDCGQTVLCPNCSVSLVHHRSQQGERMHCHYCGLEGGLPATCAHCGGAALKLLGHGTQRIEETLQKLLPGVRIARMDRDSVARKGAHQDILARLARGKIDVLVGTQMLTKGFDFPSITLVGVLLADAGLHMPDFRAAERTFQTLVQVAGRAGRGNEPGRVIFQTFQPEHATIRAAVLQDFERFYSEEIARRRAHGFPPFMRLLRVLVTSPKENECIESAEALARAVMPMEQDGLRVLGPNAAPIERIDGRYRWHILVQAVKSSLLAQAAERIESVQFSSKQTRFILDVDPVSMM